MDHNQPSVVHCRLITAILGYVQNVSDGLCLIYLGAEQIQF